MVFSLLSKILTPFLIISTYISWPNRFRNSFGKILETALEKPKFEETNAVSKQELASFVQGYFEATHVGRINITNLLECIYTADMAAMTLY